jgi:hypothetical protein
MSPQDLVNVETAACELGLSPDAVRLAIRRGVLGAVPIDRRTKVVPRSEIERYRAEHLGRRGKRTLPDEALTEQQRKRRAYQAAYYQRRKAARQQELNTGHAKRRPDGGLDP